MFLIIECYPTSCLKDHFLVTPNITNPTENKCLPCPLMTGSEPASTRCVLKGTVTYCKCKCTMYIVFLESKNYSVTSSE